MSDLQSGDNSLNLVVAFISGVLVGAVAMLFLAPRSGREIREGIYDSAVNLREQAQTERERMQVRMDEMNAKLDEVRQYIQSRGQDTEETEAVTETTVETN